MATRKTPFPHQVEDSRHLAERKLAYLAHDPRTGKTLATVLGLLAVEAKQVLIVCPIGVIPGWVDELRAWGMDAGAFCGTAKQKRLASAKPVIAINFESAWRQDWVKARKWDAVVFDEAHKLGNYKGKSTSFWRDFDFGPDCRRWMLSGTPGMESALQLVSQIFVIAKQAFGHKAIEPYLWDHWRWDGKKFKWKCLSRDHERQIREKFRKFASFRKQESLGMPAKLYEELRIDIDLEAEIKEAKAEAVTPNGTFQPMVFALRVHQLAGLHPKVLQATADFALSQEEPCLITCAYVEEVKQLAKLLDCPYILGENVKNREEIRLQFANGLCNFVVAQVKCVEAGVDFSKASCHIFHSNSWSGVTRAQAEDRTRNMNKAQSSRIVDVLPICEGLVAESVWQAVRGKVDFNESFILKGERQ